MNEQREQVIEALQSGGVGVMPTDTIYGIVASAFDADAVEHIYKLKIREPEKPFIVLLHHIEDLEQFGIAVNERLSHTLSQYWPGRTSVILHCPDEQFAYVHRDKYTLAFRVPDDEGMRSILAETGPLVAPSANVAGEPPAQTIAEARTYFGSDVDFYVDGGTIKGEPSALIDLSTETPQVLRGNP